jgi:hypothetical protein
MIVESTESVASGSRLVDDAGHSITEIVTQVHRLSDLIGDIATAANEQVHHEAVPQNWRDTHLDAADVALDLALEDIRSLPLEDCGWLNATWGIALAPTTFGSGWIAAFDVRDGDFKGYLESGADQRVLIDGLWGIPSAMACSRSPPTRYTTPPGPGNTFKRSLLNVQAIPMGEKERQQFLLHCCWKSLTVASAILQQFREDHFGQCLIGPTQRKAIRDARVQMAQ